MTVFNSVLSKSAHRESRGGSPEGGFVRHAAVPALAVALTWFVLHVPFLAPSLEDFDSINFGLALHHYDLTNNQPHPPGYPVFIAIGRVCLGAIHLVAPGVDPIRADALALAIPSAIGGAIALIAACFLFLLLSGATGRVHLWGTLLLAGAPLFWTTGLRPMSDMPGLALALVAQGLFLASLPWMADERLIAWSRYTQHRVLMAGAFVAGLAIGIRSQVVWLTLPLCILALGLAIGRQVRGDTGVRRNLDTTLWLVAGTSLAGVAGVLLWAVPMVMSVGGVGRYLQALGTQAGGDFAFVDMLWADPTPRHLVRALRETFVFPWENARLAALIGISMLGGAAVLLIRARRALILLFVAFVPYAIFHLLWQDTEFTRYALPLVVPVAYLAACGISLLRQWAPLATAGVAAFALALSVPMTVAYGAEAHPAFRALRDMLVAAREGPPARVFAHHALGRALAVPAAAALPVVEPPLGFEWLGAVEYWLSGGMQPVWFLAEPKRTDLALIDPQSRRSPMQYRWRVGSQHWLGGTRPIDADWYRLQPPGWFVGPGWSLSLEAGGVTVASKTGLDRRPIEAYIRRRPERALLLIGGRDLAAPASAPSMLEVSLDGGALDSWEFDPAQEANFLRTVELPPGRLEGPGRYATLVVSVRSLIPGRPAAPVAIRQFDVQTAPTLMYGFGSGWHEPESDPKAGTQWRWSSDRSILQVVPPQGVELRLRGESPLKYFDAPPTVRLLAGTREIATLRPDAAFDWRVRVPQDAVTQSNGAITIETDRVYLPGQVEGTGDTRRLGLRLFEIDVHPVQP